MMASSSPQNPVTSEPTPATRTLFGRWRQLLPISHQHNRTVTCYDNLGKPNDHPPEPRYVSPTTGVCRKLVIQAVHPSAPNERRISDHTGSVNKLAIQLITTSPFRRHNFFKWTGIWLLFEAKLLWAFLWLCVQVVAQIVLCMPDDSTDDSDDSEAYNTGYYKPYVRDFNGQLWEARSKKEFSARDKDEEEKEGKIETHSLYPRLLMIHDPSRDKWVQCTDPRIIRSNKYLAFSYASADVYTPGHSRETDEEPFIQEVRLATVQQKFNAYWLDLECIGETPDEKNRGVYCMADVYRRAEATLIMLGNSREGEEAAWERWGGRVWTLPEALLSHRLLYKFRDRSEINSILLHQLANLAYLKYPSEQAVINAYGGKDPLERLERLSRLKSVIWQRGPRGIKVASKPVPVESVPFPPPIHRSTIEKTPSMSGPHAAERVYALMGFFDHRIQPNYAEDELRALARLSMANDSDRIAERMVSLLPLTRHKDAFWYADDDVYKANLWDIVPEIQVAGVTENGALVLDGCRAACIRWKDFPEVASDTSNSIRRTVFRYIPYFAWPIFIAGIAMTARSLTSGGITLIVVGIVLLLASPKMFVISEAGRVVTTQPWLIGVKGVLDIDTAAKHTYGGGNMGHHRRISYTPSGSEFAVPKQDAIRGGSEQQYRDAKDKEARGTPVYTLIDTYSAAVYYFTAKKPPTVCVFTGKEGGLGRFVLCSEMCHISELRKETVIRMRTEVSQRMEMCGWIALG